MKITRAYSKEPATDGAEYGVAQIAMQQRHRARFDFAFEPVPQHKFIALAQLRQKRPEVTKIIAAVRIAHDDEASVGGQNASPQRGAIAADRDFNDARTRSQRDVSRAIGASVICDNDFARDARLLEEAKRLGDTCRKRFGLIQARH